MSLETRETKLFWGVIPGFCRDIPEVPEKFEKKRFVFNFRFLYRGGPGWGATALWRVCSCGAPATHSKLWKEPRRGCSYTLERDGWGCSSGAVFCCPLKSPQSGTKKTLRCFWRPCLMTKLKQTNHLICLGLARLCHCIGDGCRQIRSFQVECIFAHVFLLRLRPKKTTK